MKIKSRHIFPIIVVILFVFVLYFFCVSYFERTPSNLFYALPSAIQRGTLWPSPASPKEEKRTPLSNTQRPPTRKNNKNKSVNQKIGDLVSFKEINEQKKTFNMSSNDVLVFLHIQKTAGTTFERFLVKNLNISNPCKCQTGKKIKCDCTPPNNRTTWLVSRYSTGWICGVHSDITETMFSGCVENYLNDKDDPSKGRRYFVTTFLRHPIERFISEYSHINRGVKWIYNRNFCSQSSDEERNVEIPLCFPPDQGWKGVELDEFLSCPHNPAFNRQTRMLADLRQIPCYNLTHDKTSMEKLMLESARKNLLEMAYFGVKEQMAESQFLFEHLFNMNFTKSMADWNITKSSHISPTPEQMKQISDANKLDLELYQYALNLFEERLKIYGFKKGNVTSIAEAHSNFISIV